MEQLFHDFHMVHFFCYITKSLRVQRDGNSSAYAFLGPTFCQTHYFLDNNSGAFVIQGHLCR